MTTIVEASARPSNDRMTGDVAAHCFLNALIRETTDWTVVPVDGGTGASELVIPLPGAEAIHLPVAYLSPTHHHRFAFPAWRVSASGRDPVDFATLVHLVVEKLQLQHGIPTARADAFCRRVLQSHLNTHQAIDAREDWAALRTAPVSFDRAEQALLAGHAFHPAPKSREPFGTSEAHRYLPDFAARFPLRWFGVERDLIAGESLRLPLQRRLLRFATESAPQLLDEANGNRCLLPLHPWQADQLLQQAWCQRLVEQGKIIDHGTVGRAWLPTTSSRSLYCDTSRDMIKFSLSLRLTNSIRTLSLKEVRRGIRLARLAQTQRWQELQARFPTFRVMQEDGWAGMRDDGVLREESLFVLRDNLLYGNGRSQTNVLASLTQAAPDGGDSLLVAAVRRLAARLHLTHRQAAHAWVQAFCDQALIPLSVAEADYGLVLLAHQQNVLVEMQRDLPVGLLYRDCQGSYFVTHARGWLDQIGESEAENLVPPERVHPCLTYYLLVNSTFAVTAALAVAGLDSEESLMRRVRRTLEAQRRAVTNRAFLDHVLDSSHWSVKGNFFTYLHGHDENTMEDYTAIYTEVANPLPLKEKGRWLSHPLCN